MDTPTRYQTSLMKQDEKDFLITVFQRCQSEGGPKRITPRQIINDREFMMHHKRAWYLLEKWSNRGIFEYGVSIDLGWLTDKGKQIALDLIGG